MTNDAKGLQSSIWAARTRTYNSRNFDTRSQSVPPSASPATPPPATLSRAAATSSSSTSLTPAQAFHRFEQACHRLRWKFVDLQNSYKRATAPEEHGFTEEDAERNFKVDFHEFYTWIEQALVLLLLIWGVRVPRTKPTERGSSAHAFHHNVLMMLDDELNNPLYEALGQGDVKHALWKAKELRNRWKDAADGQETTPLKMYDLTWIVTQILGGLEVAYGIAAAWVQQQTLDAGMGNGVGEVEEEGWEWMVEAMDWEA